MQHLKQHHYKGYPTTWEVHIQDRSSGKYKLLSNDPNTISNISRSLDYPNLANYKTGECSISFNDPKGMFSPNADKNYFTENGFDRSGYRVGVQVKGGFIVNGQKKLDLLFIGNIIRVTYNADDAISTLVCSDRIRDLYIEDLKNYGIERKFGLVQDRGVNSRNGVYPIMKALLPPSEDSVVTNKASGDENIMNLVEELATEGNLNPNNYIVSDTGVETEGGPIIKVDSEGEPVLDDAGNIQPYSEGYPQIEFKSPHRYTDIGIIVKNVLSSLSEDSGNNEDIPEKLRIKFDTSNIEIPNQTVDRHFSSNGRVLYNLVGSQDKSVRVSFAGSTVWANWEGYVTDALYINGKYYFLYNSSKLNDQTEYYDDVKEISDLDGSSILEYDPSLGYYRQVYHIRPASKDDYSSSLNRGKIPTYELWKFDATDSIVSGSITFFVLTIRSRALDTNHYYDAIHPACRSEIRQISIPEDLTDSSFEDGNRTGSINYVQGGSDSVLVSSTESTYKPQLAHYYHLGNLREGQMLPDSRRKIIWHTYGNDAKHDRSGLYYAYVNRNTEAIKDSKFGIARARLDSMGDPVIKNIIEVDIDFAGSEVLENHAGISFSIDTINTSDILSGGVTFRGNKESDGTTGSCLTRFEKNLSS